MKVTQDESAKDGTALHRRMVRQNSPRLSYDGGDVVQWQQRLRPRLRELMGPWPAERPPLAVRTAWEQETPLGRIARIVFTAEPDCPVPAYVCTPGGVEPPYDWFICVQGHSTGMHNSIAVDAGDESRSIEVAGDRDFALGCMRRGLAALCIEQRSFGERSSKEDTHLSCDPDGLHALQLGRTLTGERVYDVDRALDYLATRDDVNMDRIGIMGNSSGGTTSVFSAALLERLAFAMPSCYFCTFADSIMSIHHCLCNYVPGLLQEAEMADVLGLFAPRPVVVVAGEQDEIFPIEATGREFERLRTIYAAAGAPDACRLVVGSGGHRFYADDAWPEMLELMHGAAG
jgi:dienelactone hydrolase